MICIFTKHIVQLSTQKCFFDIRPFNVQYLVLLQTLNLGSRIKNLTFGPSNNKYYYSYTVLC